MAIAAVWFSVSANGQVITLEDELNSERTPPAGLEPPQPSAPEPQSPAEAVEPVEPVEPRADVSLELIPPATSPEEPFIPAGEYQPDLVQDAENEILFGPQPAEDIATESDRVSTEPAPIWFFGEWLGNLLAMGSS
ncbi:MAG: hypothetical protein ACOVMP_01360, partial [Chthoniobacterales bacterium]